MVPDPPTRHQLTSLFSSQAFASARACCSFASTSLGAERTATRGLATEATEDLLTTGLGVDRRAIILNARCERGWGGSREEKSIALHLVWGNIL